MKRISLLVMVCAVFCACSDNSHTDSGFTPAKLIARRANLYPMEFAAQQKKYADVLEKLRIEPKNPAHLNTLAKIYMSEARTTGEHPYYYPAAMKALDAALTLDAKNVESTMLRTSVLLSLHHFGEAREAASKLAVEYPAIAAVFGMKCDAEVELGHYESAVAAVDNMMSLRPSLESYARASYLREIHGDPDGAVEAMNMAVKAGLPGTEDAAWTRTTLGTLYLHRGKMTEAGQEYQLACMERKSYPFAMAGLAMVYHAEKRDGDALRLLDSALSMMPEISFVEKKATIFHHQGNTHKTDSLLAVIENMMNDDEAAGHINNAERALIYAKFNYKPAEALAHATKEIAIRPDNITAQFAMAYSLFRASKFSQAREYLAKARRKNTQDADMIALAAAIEQQAGNTADAAKYQQQVAGINPFYTSNL